MSNNQGVDPMRILFWLGIPIAFWGVIVWGAVHAHAEDTGACVEQHKEKLCEEQAETAFNRCWAKIRRFEDTEASAESRARFLWRCGYQAGVWNRRDP
jgi:hypothetical protein